MRINPFFVLDIKYNRLNLGIEIQKHYGKIIYKDDKISHSNRITIGFIFFSVGLIMSSKAK